MKLANKYVKGAKISEVKFRMLMKCFTADLSATQTSEITGINRNTVNRYFNAVRKRICEIYLQENPFQDSAEAGESNLFGLWQQEGKIRAEIVPDTSRDIFHRIIRNHIDPENVIHPNGWRSYDAWVDIGSGKYYRFNQNTCETVDGKKQVDDIESFWIFAKTRLAQFHGISKNKFLLHLKECEFRFNYRNEDIYKLLLSVFRNHPLF